MTKQKISIAGRFKHLFTHHPWLKLIALGMAIMLWFYARGEISRFNY